MKRSLPEIDQQSTNDNGKLYEAPNTKMVRPSFFRSECDDKEESKTCVQRTTCDQNVNDKAPYWSPRCSSIVGSFSEPTTSVIHFLDAHLTILHRYQICSLFGRVRIHGYKLRPLTFYSIHNYRMNSPLPIQLIDSSTTTSLEDVKSLIHDTDLADSAYSSVIEKGGDILLLRKESDNDSIFMENMKKHRFYKNWFPEIQGSYKQDEWRQLEQVLNIRLIETTDQNAVIPRNEVTSIADRIIQRCLDKMTEDTPIVVLVCGEKDLGKSTLTRYLTNCALDRLEDFCNITYIDCDLGQCEFTIGGCLSYVNVTAPLLGPPFSHIRSNPKPNRLLYYGYLSPQAAPVRYLQYVYKLKQLWTIDHKNKVQKKSLILLNTMGWGTGLGLELLKETIFMYCPNVVIQLEHNTSLPDDRNKMPSITVEWLRQQPTFVPYRNAMQMDGRRLCPTNGHIDYEYFKVQSGAIIDRKDNNAPKLRPRDHRLLATWSYFFFSHNPLPKCISWPELVHVSLLHHKDRDSSIMPNLLKHSLVALCSSENIAQLRALAHTAHGTFQLFNYQNELFECLGFGWIENCHMGAQTYEIYTPVDDLSNVTLIVQGQFDTPDEFQNYFHCTHGNVKISMPTKSK